MSKSNNNQHFEKMSILIPDAEDWLTVKVLRCLGKKSKVVSHILSKKKGPLSRFSRYCKSFHFNKSQNDDEWIEEINKLIKKLRINIVLPVTVSGFELISNNRTRISESALIPPLPESEKIALTNNKWEFYKFLVQHNLPSVPTVYAGNSGGEINIKEKDSIKFPALLKPVSGDGGYGILKVENPEDLEQAWHDKRMMKNKDYILQSYIPSVHFALSFCSREGEVLAYTLYNSLVQPNPYRIGEVMEFKNDDKVVSIGNQLVSDLKWSGVANIDFLVDKRDNSVTILEFNPRFWQSLLGSAIAGVNFPLLWCLDTMGVESSFSQNQITRYASSTMYAKTLLNRLKGKQTTPQIRWKESGLRFTCSDPLPEIVELLNRTGKKLKNRIKSQSSSSDNHN